jgi:hypothetical protein
MTQTPAAVNAPVSSLSNPAHTENSKHTTSWSPPYPEST